MLCFLQTGEEPASLLTRMRKFFTVVFLAAYILSPIDLIPEALVGLPGVTDDLVALTLLLQQLVKWWAERSRRRKNAQAGIPEDAKRVTPIVDEEDP